MSEQERAEHATEPEIKIRWDGCGCKYCKELGALMQPLDAPLRAVAKSLYDKNYPLVGAVVDQVLHTLSMMSSVHIQDVIIAADSFLTVRRYIRDSVQRHQVEGAVEQALVRLLKKMMMPVGSVKIEDGFPPGMPGFSFGLGEDDDDGGGNNYH